MKLVKMSLLAATLVASSAFAIDNVKVSGDARLYYDTAVNENKDGATGDKTYNTFDADKGSLFDPDNSAGQAALNIGLTADLTEGISAGATLSVLSTLGLENNLVRGVWAGNIAPTGAYTEALAGSNGTGWWMSELWAAGTLGKTTAKVGRQNLDTPLAFTEKWNIASNSFEAFVLLNQDIPHTTLVAAYVGGSNGANSATVQNAQNGDNPFTGYTTYNDALQGLGFGGQGAYAAGFVTNFWEPLTIQGWYYDVRRVATAYWLQGDMNLNGILVGAQFAQMDPSCKIHVVGDSTVHEPDFENSTAFSVMAGYEMKDTFSVKVAVSQTADDGALNIQNTATGDQTKLYTEAWWNYGVVGSAGTTAVSVYGDYIITSDVNVFAQVTSAAKDVKGAGSAAAMAEVTLGANATFGPLDTSLVLISTAVENGDAGNQWNAIGGANADDEYSDSRVQAYLTYNF